MIQFEKIFKMPCGKDEYNDLKVKVVYGFDESIIENHPKEFEKGKEEILFMFVDMNETWFDGKQNDNNYIEVLKINMEDTDVTEESLDKVVSKIFDKQIEALEFYFNKNNINEIDKS